MKQIHGVVQALESGKILAAILDFVEETKKLPDKFPGVHMHTENI